ncbi:MAG TPA: hypothetical protein PL017_07270 [Tenuifilaceae bacterium]|nr:hypothetical protein [Tenuifilaceae bacterium]HPE17154.1 hypothetical protein [Tenuifilaceae bacterium]HPJ45882.1 hypothetical protein [Tenuifilaceae bacterium]HPQ34087.1 hypothetical protein [Tenuifilaceae bacterium]HRX68742.1 hypothetical protein [Tenuifilaceae bacterium]
MRLYKLSERRVILLTVSLIVLSGILSQFNYTIGIVLFYVSFAPYLTYRVIRILKKRWGNFNRVDKYRFVVLIVMIVSLTFNILGWQEADFFLLFLLMVDFLLVYNKKF